VGEGYISAKFSYTVKAL